MAFVAGRVRNEEDKRYIYSVGFLDVLGDPLDTPRYWAIDRELGRMFVSCGGGGPELPEKYALYVDGMIIDIEGHENSDGNMYQGGVRIQWKIRWIGIPKSWLEKGGDIEQLKEIIREACIAYASRGLKPSQIQDIVVEFKEEFTVK